VLDWGGAGPALCLIHGIDDNPHVFDDLAPLLTDRHHVFAYARRGHGGSDKPTSPYDPDTLVDDLRHVLDQLGIARASLLGWSMGGNEITTFAGRYPERVAGLVYLDGGYDWSDTTFATALGGLFDVLQPRESDLGSLDAYRAWYRATWLGDTLWTSGLEAYLRDTVSMSGEGALDSVMPDAVHDALFHTLATWPRDYVPVRAPALALYAPTFLSTEAATSSAAHDFEYAVMVPFRRASIERIQHELAGVDVREIAHTSHMSIGVADPHALATMVSDFLVAAQA
jgi:pimeloyl-ACP methyl ester carboxylesterase